MRTQVHVAAKKLSGALSAYAKRFDFLEVTEIPSPAGMRKWRKDVPPHFDFSVKVPRGLAALPKGKEFDEGVKLVRAAMDHLQARWVLIATPPEVTPSPLAREKLQRLFQKLPNDVSKIAWEPSGIWETEDAARFAKKCKVALVVDPTRDEVPDGSMQYLRIRSLGESRSPSADSLSRVMDRVRGAKEAYFVIESDKALTACKELRRLSQEAAGPRGGLGRIVRPAALRVSDDEQE